MATVEIVQPPVTALVPGMGRGLEGRRTFDDLEEFEILNVRLRGFAVGVDVDRTLTPRQIVDASGQRHKSIDPVALASMPAGLVRSVRMLFLNFGANGGRVPPDTFHRVLQKLGAYCDPYGVAAVNAQFPELSERCQNGTQWVDANGGYNLISYSGIGFARTLVVAPHMFCWGPDWYLGVTVDHQVIDEHSVGLISSNLS